MAKLAAYDAARSVTRIADESVDKTMPRRRSCRNDASQPAGWPGGDRYACAP